MPSQSQSGLGWQRGLGLLSWPGGRKGGARATGASGGSEERQAARTKAAFLVLMKARLLGG